MLEPTNIAFMLSALGGIIFFAGIVYLTGLVCEWAHEVSDRKQERLCERAAWDYDEELQKEAYISLLRWSIDNCSLI